MVRASQITAQNRYCYPSSNINLSDTLTSMETNLNLDWYDVSIKFARLAFVLIIGSLILSASKSIIF